MPEKGSSSSCKQKDATSMSLAFLFYRTQEDASRSQYCEVRAYESSFLRAMALGEWEGLAYAEVVRLNEAVHLHGVTAKFWVR